MVMHLRLSKFSGNMVDKNVGRRDPIIFFFSFLSFNWKFLVVLFLRIHIFSFVNVWVLGNALERGFQESRAFDLTDWRWGFIWTLDTNFFVSFFFFPCLSLDSSYTNQHPQQIKYKRTDNKEWKSLYIYNYYIRIRFNTCLSCCIHIYIIFIIAIWS